MDISCRNEQKDNAGAWEPGADGRYYKRKPRGKTAGLLCAAANRADIVENRLRWI